MAARTRLCPGASTSNGKVGDAMGQASEWYRHSFAEDYLRVYRHRDAAEASRALAKLLARVNLPAGARCLDLCCGSGRHLAVLRRQGLEACGVDLSPALLREAARDPGLAGRLIRADMRALPFPPVFDFVFSFFTSFGYFPDDAENARVVRQIASVLRTGGGFLIDFLNTHRVQADLVPLDIRHTPDFTLIQRRWIDPLNGSIDKELCVEDAHGRRCYRERVKLYGEADFRRFCAAAGLTVDALLGSPDGEPYGIGSPRLIVLGHKPRATGSCR